MDKALIYLRVSTMDQARKELPIESQRSRCIDYAKSKNLRVDPDSDVYVDRGISGRSLESRLGLQELMRRCKEDDNVKAVVFYDVSRLARNLLDYQIVRNKLQSNGVSVFSATEAISGDDTPSGWMVENMMAMFAEFRSRQDGEKIKNSMLAKAEGGIYPGYAPYGYKNMQEQISSAKSKRWMDIDENEAPWVKRCHELFSTDTCTMRELAEKLRSEGMVPPKRGKLHMSLIDQILRNDIYIGVIRWGGVVNKNGTHTHILDKDLFSRNQAIMGIRNGGISRKRKYSYVLRTANAVCGECGSRMTAGFHKGKSKRYERYSCTKKIAGEKVACSQSVVPVDVLEKSFSNTFKRVQMSETAVNKLRDKVKDILERDGETDLNLFRELNTRLVNNRVAQKRLLEKYAEGKVNDEMYETTQIGYTEAEDKLKEDIAGLDVRINKTKEILEIALGLVNNCYRAYKKAPNDELRALLAKAFFKKIEVSNGIVSNVVLNQPFYFLAENKVKKSDEFRLAYTGGDGGN